VELLSPAGDRDALNAALAGGADAIYVGFTRFSARRSAANFCEDDLRRAIDDCHERGVRVYAAVNTLIAPSEWSDALDVLALLREMRADAVIVQDIGLMRAAREMFPEIPVHASTQMSIHNRSGAAWAARHGASRVIAARECSAADIAAMSKETEVEAFVHGALCASVSGQCLLSSFIGGRSGNRGACAQPCRLRYRWNGSEGALLSPRDQAQFNSIKTLVDAGVAALKIEGRMKRPSYVYIATRAYRDALGRFAQCLPTQPNGAAMDSLRQAFHRGGFCGGYIGGAEDSAIIYTPYAGNEGVPIGAVLRASAGGFADIKLTADLNKGDTLRVGERAFPCAVNQAAGQTVRLKAPEGARAGDTVYRQTDASLDLEAARAVPAPIPVRMEFYARPRQPARLTVSDGSINIEAESDEHVQPAERRATQPDAVRAQLSKTGGTAYTAASIEVDAIDAHLPLSMLNRLRADALTKLRRARIDSYALYDAPARILPQVEAPRFDQPSIKRIVARHADASVGALLLNAGADAFEWAPKDLRQPALDEQVSLLPTENCIFVLPEFLTEDTLDYIFEWATSHRDAFEAIVVSNPGQIDRAWNMPIHADAAIHVFNPQAAAALFDDGCSRVTLSPELTFAQIRSIARHGGSMDIHAYGRERLMLLSHCPARVARGLAGSRANCAICESGEGADGTTLRDRMGVEFPLSRVRTALHCRLRVLNSVPTDLSRAAGFIDLPVSWRLLFWDETALAAQAIVRRYRGLLASGILDETPCAAYTTGHAHRPV
jgi:putative protease